MNTFICGKTKTPYKTQNKKDPLFCYYHRHTHNLLLIDDIDFMLNKGYSCKMITNFLIKKKAELDQF